MWERKEAFPDDLTALGKVPLIIRCVEKRVVPVFLLVICRDGNYVVRKEEKKDAGKKRKKDS